MSQNVLVVMAISFATTALVSFGGIAGMTPEIHRIAVDVHGWMTDSQFATTFALSQIAPGPNILLMSLVGWRVDGLAGMLVGTFATVVPTALVAFSAHRAEVRLSRANWYAVLRRSLPPIVVGLIAASALVTARASIGSYLGAALAVGVAGYVGMTKTNPLVPLLAAVVVGVIGGRLGLL